MNKGKGLGKCVFKRWGVGEGYEDVVLFVTYQGVGYKKKVEQAPSIISYLPYVSLPLPIDLSLDFLSQFIIMVGGRKKGLHRPLQIHGMPFFFFCFSTFYMHYICMSHG